jgi:hypothetical protein
MSLRDRKDEIVAGGVACAAFISSAQHIVEVVLSHGVPMAVAAVHPLGLDGLIYVGIRAMQKGNKRSGFAAIAYGAAYSLLFNMDSYSKSFDMPPILLAASMPLAMLFAFLIVHSSHAPEVRYVEVPGPERIVEVPGPERIVEVPGPERIVVREIEAPKRPPVRVHRDEPSTSTGRVAGWDVEKAVRLMDEGRTNEEIASTLGNVGPKPIQRTRRAVTMIKGGTQDDALIGKECGLSAAHVARVRKAVGA